MVGAKAPAWAIKAAQKIAALIWTGERSALELPDEPEMACIIADACPAGKLAKTLKAILDYGELSGNAEMAARAALQAWRESQ